MTNILTTITYALVGLAGLGGIVCRVAEDRIDARAIASGAARICYDAARAKGKRWHRDGE